MHPNRLLSQALNIPPGGTPLIYPDSDSSYRGCMWIPPVPKASDLPWREKALAAGQFDKIGGITYFYYAIFLDEIHLACLVSNTHHINTTYCKINKL
jgi:hypothetical protein